MNSGNTTRANDVLQLTTKSGAYIVGLFLESTEQNRYVYKI